MKNLYCLSFTSARKDARPVSVKRSSFGVVVRTPNIDLTAAIYVVFKRPYEYESQLPHPYSREEIRQASNTHSDTAIF